MGLDVPARRRGGCGGLWCYELRYGSGTRIDAFGLWGAMWKSMGPGRAAALARASSLGWEGGEEASVRVKGRDRLCGRVCERGGIAVERSGD